MPQVVQTHINALYADLTTAKQEADIAQGKVEILEDQIRGRGGVVPGEEVDTPSLPKEDTVTAEDVSATESVPKPPAPKETPVPEPAPAIETKPSKGKK